MKQTLWCGSHEWGLKLLYIFLGSSNWSFLHSKHHRSSLLVINLLNRGNVGEFWFFFYWRKRWSGDFSGKTIDWVLFYHKPSYLCYNILFLTKTQDYKMKFNLKFHLEEWSLERKNWWFFQKSLILVKSSILYIHPNYFSINWTFVRLKSKIKYCSMTLKFFGSKLPIRVNFLILKMIRSTFFSIVEQKSGFHLLLPFRKLFI